MATPQQKPFILIDGSSYLFRAYHALPPLTNAQGEPTGAMYGVINMIRKLIKDYEPEQIGVIFDPKGKTFRHKLYKEYKANRPEMPEELRVQILPLFNIIKAMGLPLLIIDEVEADDVIGTLTHQASQHKIPVLVSTGDKDLAQLVNPHVTLINTMNNQLLDPKGVQEKFGVPPELIIDYLTLIGDTSDNIPGVPKVGPKTAVKWLTEYGSLDNIIANADKIKGKVGENLRATLNDLPLSRQLVTIKLDVDLPCKIGDFSPTPPDNKSLHQYYSHYGFKSWLAEVDNVVDTQPSSAYTTILEQSTFKTWLKKLKAAKAFAFDTETTSLNTVQAEIVGVSFAVETNQAAYIPLAHDYVGAPSQLERDWVLEQLKPLLEDPNKAKIGQHLKYDKNVLYNYGITLQGIAFDTMLESYVLNSTATRHDMDSLAHYYLGKETIHYEDVAGKGAKQIPFSQVAIEVASDYAAEDADITLQLHESLWPKLRADKTLLPVYNDIEIPLVPVLSKMECTGVLVSKDMLAKQSKALAKRITTIQELVYKNAGEVFNLASPKQLQAILFEKMKIPVVQKTPSGQPSTAENVLEELALDYELPKLILEFRSLSKLKSTYTDKLPEQIDSKTGRVHTSYHQAVTSTGRLSSTDPNLQNIPIRTEAGRKIRQAFIAPKNYKIVAADYSQIELRIMAHLSQDKGLLKAFTHELDIHAATASEVYGVAIDNVSGEQRRSAKAINFGLIYGMSAFGLSKQLGIERGLAQEYMDLYFSRYPGVKTYMENTRALAHKQGYVETLSGRRLYMAEINSRNHQRQRAAERAAINAPMQGTAADIIKIAMINIDQWLSKNNIDAKMIMQVHDELVFEVHESIIDDFMKHVALEMANSLTLDIPLRVEVGVGDNWDEAH